MWYTFGLDGSEATGRGVEADERNGQRIAGRVAAVVWLFGLSVGSGAGDAGGAGGSGRGGGDADGVGEEPLFPVAGAFDGGDDGGGVALDCVDEGSGGCVAGAADSGDLFEFDVGFGGDDASAESVADGALQVGVCGAGALSESALSGGVAGDAVGDVGD